MSRARVLIATLMFVTFAGTSSAQQKGRKVAFLVGVGAFKHDLPDLNGSPQKDVTELAKVLREGGFEVVLLKDADATKANVEKRFRGVLDGDGNTARSLGKNDLLLVAVCTHGFSLSPANDAPESPFLAAHDSKLDNAGTMVSLNAMIDGAKSSGGTVLYLIDACREMPKDANRGQTRGIEGTQVVLPKGTAVLFSCGRHQVSHQSDQADGHGLFTFAVLKTLRGQGTQKETVSWAGLVFEVENAFRSPEFQKMIPERRPQRPFVATGELDFTDLLAVGGPLAGDVELYRAAQLRDAVRDHLIRVAPTRLAAWQAHAQLGAPNGQLLHGMYLDYVTGTTADISVALDLYTKSAAAGNALAMYNLALMYFAGRGVPRSDASAFHWFEKATIAGEKLAHAHLGRMYEDGRGTPANAPKALDCYLEAANAGMVPAMVSAAGMYEHGRGTKKSDENAFKWYDRAADAGNTVGLYNAAWMQERGLGTLKNVPKAFERFKTAAIAGHRGAMYSLGLMYETGSGTKQDDAEAVKWLDKSAADGWEYAMVHLGRRYENGRGVPKNEKTAFAWYEKAAALKNPMAIAYLGDCYERGIGTEKNVAKALEYYRRAANLGDAFAKNAVARLEKK